MRFLSFGELLFDILPSGNVLGGAPVNVATHLSRLSAESYLISAIGADELGAKAIEQLSKEGVNTDFVALSGFDTGRADVVLDDGGSARYEFNFPSAWDEIRLFPQEKNRVESISWDGFIFGTLAMRSDITKETLLDILDNIDAKEILFDINLRGDFFSRAELLLGLEYATILKLNEEELEVFLPLLEFDSIYDLFKQYGNLNGILLTRGADGIEYITEENVIKKDSLDTTVVDTVGAGDSVSAAFLYFYTLTHDINSALEKASLLSGFVVSTKGATAEYTERIREALRQ